MFMSIARKSRFMIYKLQNSIVFVMNREFYGAKRFSTFRLEAFGT